jgi:hypothetical protein
MEQKPLAFHYFCWHFLKFNINININERQNFFSFCVSRFCVVFEVAVAITVLLWLQNKQAFLQVQLYVYEYGI